MIDSIYRWPNIDIAKMLIDAGADVNITDQENGLQYPALIRAISNKDEEMVGESVRPDQMASGGIGGFGPKYFSISALLRPKAFFVKSHSRVGRFRITFRRRSTRFCQYL